MDDFLARSRGSLRGNRPPPFILDSAAASDPFSTEFLLLCQYKDWVALN